MGYYKPFAVKVGWRNKDAPDGFWWSKRKRFNTEREATEHALEMNKHGRVVVVTWRNQNTGEIVVIGGWRR